MQRSIWTCTLVALLAGTSPMLSALAGEPGDSRSTPDATAALAVLRNVLQDGNGRARLRAAESLLFHNCFEDVQQAYHAEVEEDSPSFDQIGTWRVLARLAGNDKQLRAVYVDRIVAALCDARVSNRKLAAESLAELGDIPATPEICQIARQEKGALGVFALWTAANAERSVYEPLLADRLDSEDPSVRAATAFALCHLDRLDLATYDKLYDALAREPDDSPARASISAAVLVHAPTFGDTNVALRCRDELGKYLKSRFPMERADAAGVLALAGSEADLPLLGPLLNDETPDVRVQAANATLRIGRRQFRGLQWFDWCVIGSYGIFVLGVGIYCSRRQTSTEEYFLAGRNMHPVLIGISMFASLVSTISYLGDAGEIIKHGPIILCAMLAIPFAYVVIGYALIPHIMKLRTTTRGTEILERRFGPGVSLLGSTIFIATRLVWMALLIHISGRLLVETLNWHKDAVFWVVAVAGTIAVIYAAIGGLRAVIITEVFQAIILIGGALATIGLISYEMGGFSWFPTHWQPHWDRQPFFSWNPTTPVTVVGAIVSSLCWWICIAGSDQIAIQRYFATRDVKAARRAFLVNSIFGSLVDILLYSIGFALLGFFAANQHLVPDGKTLIADADYLFPRYIANYLPVGVAGLVIAGMCASSMSCMNSGINSIVTVITRDFIDRCRGGCRPDGDSDAHSAHRAKWLVFVIGLAVVLLSTQVERVPGNIVETVNKVTGLFVAPLFGLFFMALFVGRATALATIVGAVYGLATTTCIAFWDQITGAPQSLSFQWIVPAAMLVQTCVGLLLTWIPVKKMDRRSQIIVGFVAILPLAAVYLALLTHGLDIATYLQWGVTAN